LALGHVPVYSAAYAGTKLHAYCLVTEAHVRERLAEGCTRQGSSRDWTRDLQSQVQRPKRHRATPL